MHYVVNEIICIYFWNRSLNFGLNQIRNQRFLQREVWIFNAHKQMSFYPVFSQNKRLNKYGCEQYMKNPLWTNVQNIDGNKTWMCDVWKLICGKKEMCCNILSCRRMDKKRLTNIENYLYYKFNKCLNMQMVHYLIKYSQISTVSH